VENSPVPVPRGEVIVEALRNRSGTAPLDDAAHAPLARADRRRDLQQIAGPHQLVRLGVCAVDGDLAAITRLRREGARAKRACRLEPAVDAERGGGSIVGAHRGAARHRVGGGVRIHPAAVVAPLRPQLA
jgi:hypothetical protein